MFRWLEISLLLLLPLSAYADSEQGYDYVDLGLPSATLWATVNIGAETETDAGDYFAWGEVSPKDAYSWYTYLWLEPGQSTSDYICKYTLPDRKYVCSWYSDDSVFVGDGLTELLPEDDAASVCWGGRWRMPTEEDWTELLSLCDTTLTYYGDVFGLEVVGPNGHRIFLPAAGYRGTGKRVARLNEGGFYYSSSHYRGQTTTAYRINFGPVEVTSSYGWAANRYIGRTIRPVLRLSVDAPTGCASTASGNVPSSQPSNDCASARIVLSDGTITILLRGLRYSLLGHKL